MELSNFKIPLLFIFLIPISAQLSTTDTNALFQIQKLLEYPEPLQWWTRGINFCSLPPSPSLKIICTNHHITELSIVGNKTSPAQTQKPNQALSGSFSIDSLFTTLTRIPSLKSISLVNLGLWGELPPKIKRLLELEVLNVSSNFISGEIPVAIGSIKNLKSLVLSNNLFHGTVPDLAAISGLEEVNLGGNHLGPEFPSLGNNLRKLNLRNNSFRCEIPLEIENFHQLFQLDISWNKFVGPIPSFLFSLPVIQYLDLAQNQFSGALPVTTSCGKNLDFLDISHNFLIGKLPSCISSYVSNRTVISSWNCLLVNSLQQQHPHSFCDKGALAVKPPETKETMEVEKAKARIHVGLILGILGGVLVIAVVSAVLAAIAIKRSYARSNEDGNRKGSVVAHKMPPTRSAIVPPNIPRRVPQTMRSAAIGLPPYRVFTLEEIEDATNNFDPANFMGDGSQGKLYRGWLRDGCVVVVRCLKLKQKQSQQNLMQDLEVLSKLRHRHLVSVLGHCVVTYQDHPNTASTVFVVLENVSNGSLQDYLTDWRKKEMLKWPQRVAITIGAVRGIQFLHTGVAPGIFGNFLKIDNILLDETLTAKVCSYRIPLQPKGGSESPLNGHDHATRFHSDGNAEEEDIYQLGVILLEVITGKLVASTDELDELKLYLERGLTKGTSTLKDVIDPSIQGTFANESMRTTVQLAVNCLGKDASKHPSIEDVLWNLQYSIQVQESWTSSTGSLSTLM